MVGYHSDEQQFEELKKWWKENGKSAIAGVILGIGGLLAWRGWTYYQVNHAKAASELYAQMQQAVARDEINSIIENAQNLRDDYAATPYASLAALELAKLKGESGQLQEAAEQLRWVMANSPQEALINIAKIRLARVLNAQKHYDKVLEVLAGEFPLGYSSLIEEIRGDALRAKGDIDEARQAYTRALMEAGGESDYLKMKRDDLGGVPNTDSTDQS
jgi:predicted negative regulator of RcsB-dependent stress response